MSTRIKNTFVIVLGAVVIQSCSVLGLVQSKKPVTGDYVVELVPVDKKSAYDMSINVVQGIAAFEGGWFTGQTSASKYLLINYLDETGRSVFNKRFNINSHAQDLSYEQISENELYLYTTEGYYDRNRASGMVRLKVTLPEKVNGKRDMSKMVIEKDQIYDLNLTNSTPTLSEDKKYFAIRSSTHIYIAPKEDVLNGVKDNVKIFDLDPGQLKNGEETLWFQGIAMKDDKIYCMTGNNSIGSPKYLYVYSMDGEVLEKHSIELDDFARQLGTKLEPEGITFDGDDLYYAIMIKGKTGGNRKFLFKFDD